MSDSSSGSSLAGLPTNWTRGASWTTCSASAYVSGTTSAASTALKETVLPTITGQAVQGKTLSTTSGSWAGSPTSYVYRGQDCNSSGAGCTTVSGATSSSYVLASGDVGHTMRVVVSATNGGGSTSASSAQTAVVTKSQACTTTINARSIATAISNAVAGNMRSIHRLWQRRYEQWRNGHE
jgi:hypothetical protein